MKNLVEAIKQVEADLENGETFQQAVKFAAEEFSLNPMLVIRKFEEKHGNAEKYVAAVQTSKRTFATYIQTEIDRVSGQYRYTPERKALVGRKFKFKGVDYHYIAYTGKKMGVVSIEANTGISYTINSRFYHEIMKQIKA